MAITFRTSAAGGATSGTSDRTAAITPAVGDLFIVFTYSAGPASTVTLSDNNGGTYTKLDSGSLNSNADKLNAWVRDQRLANTTSTTLTLAGGSNTAGEIVIHAYSGSTRYGVDAVRGFSNITSGVFSAAGTPTSAAIKGRPGLFAGSGPSQVPLTSNPVAFAIFTGTNGPTVAAPTGFTPAQNVGQNSPAIGIETWQRDSGFTSSTVACTGTSATAGECIAVVLDGSNQEEDEYGDATFQPASVATRTALARDAAAKATAIQFVNWLPYGDEMFPKSLPAASGSFALTGSAATIGQVSRYPISAAEMATAVGYGTWTAGYLMQEGSGALKATFGGTADLTSNGTTGLTYGQPGMILNDHSVQSTTRTTRAQSSSTSDFDLNGTDDFAFAIVHKIPDTSAAGTILAEKTAHNALSTWSLEKGSGNNDATVFFYDGAGHLDGPDWLFANNEWMVTIFVVDRGANKMAGSSYGQSSGLLGGRTDVTSITASFPGNGNFSNAIAWCVGDQANADAVLESVAAIYIAVGSGAAANMAANLDTAVTNLFNYITATSAKTLTAASGTFAETGTAATLERGLLVGASSGTYAETGSNATLEVGRKLSAGSGTFTETGTAATLERSRDFVAGSGTFLETGTAAALEHGYVVGAGAGSFAETGSSANLKHGYVASAGVGAFVETGSDVTFFHDDVEQAGSGTFVETGSDATLEVGHRLAAGAGSFAETGTSADLKHGYPMPAGSGTFVETGSSVGLRATRDIAADSGAFAETGSDVDFMVGYTLPAGSGSVAETGSNASLVWDHVLAAGSGAFLETGTAASLVHGYPLVASSGSFAETGSDAQLRATRVIGAGSGSFAETGGAAGLEHGYPLAAGSGTYAETGSDASLRHDGVLGAGPGAIALTGSAVNFEVGFVVASGTFALTGTNASLRATRRLAADGGAFAETGTDAELEAGRVLSAGSGAYVETGSDADLTHGIANTLSAGSGTFAEVGSIAVLEVGRVLSADGATFLETGGDVDFFAGYTMPVDSGAFVEAGSSATLLRDGRLVAGVGIFVEHGFAATLFVTPVAPPNRSGPIPRKLKTYAQEIANQTVSMSVDVYSVDMEISEVTVEMTAEVIE